MPVVERLERGFDQQLGRRFEGGVELSGGEWQKVALARAYMRDAQILILDEPTAALDARADYQVFRRVADLAKEKIALIISHRFSTARVADHIVALECGRLVEQGTHEKLIPEPKPLALLAAIMLTLMAQRISGLAWAKVQRLPSGSAAS